MGSFGIGPASWVTTPRNPAGIVTGSCSSIDSAYGLIRIAARLEDLAEDPLLTRLGEDPAGRQVLSAEGDPDADLVGWHDELRADLPRPEVRVVEVSALGRARRCSGRPPGRPYSRTCRPSGAGLVPCRVRARAPPGGSAPPVDPCRLRSCRLRKGPAQSRYTPGSGPRGPGGPVPRAGSISARVMPDAPRRTHS